MVANRTVKGDGETPGGGAASQCSGYVLPLVHARVPESVGGVAFVESTRPIGSFDPIGGRWHLLACTA